MTKRLALTLLLSSITILLTSCSEIGHLFIPEVVRGSGNVLEKRFDVGDFTKVSIASRFTAEIRHGETFSVVVRADDNLIEDARVNMRGDTLEVSMTRKNRVSYTEQHVIVTMPAIESLTASGVSKVELGAFPQSPSLTIDVNSVSQVSGEANAAILNINLITQSRILLAGAGESLVLSADSLGSANLANLRVATANISLSNGSNADVTVSQRIDLEASNNSHLTYGGGAVLGNIDLDTTSTVTERDDETNNAGNRVLYLVPFDRTLLEEQISVAQMRASNLFPVLETDSWEEVQRMAEGGNLDALIIHHAALDVVDSSVLQRWIYPGGVVVAGVDIPGDTLAEVIGWPSLYDPAMGTYSGADFFFVYSVDDDGTHSTTDSIADAAGVSRMLAVIAEHLSRGE